MLSAPAPTTCTCPDASSGSAPSFFSSTSDLRTASRASSRCAGEPSRSTSPASGRALGFGFANTPAAILARRMRRLASSSRAMGMRPDFTCASVDSHSPFQLSGAIYMSSPASSACGQSVAVQSGMSACPFQSPTTKPVKPILSLSTSVSSALCPCRRSPCQDEKLAITDSAPAASAVS